jgi:hypothetical protein
MRRILTGAAVPLVLAASVAGCGSVASSHGARPAASSAAISAPAAAPSAASSAASFACTVVTHNADTAAVNQFIAANGWDDSNASRPQLSVTVTAGSQDAVVASVTVAGYDGSGQETGSTDVPIGQVITAGQSMTFAGDLPWYQVSEYDSWGNPTVYVPGASACRVVSYS